MNIFRQMFMYNIDKVLLDKICSIFPFHFPPFLSMGLHPQSPLSYQQGHRSTGSQVHRSTGPQVHSFPCIPYNDLPSTPDYSEVSKDGQEGLLKPYTMSIVVHQCSW